MIYLIPEYAIPGDSKATGIIFLYSPEKKKTKTKTEKNWSGNENKREYLCSLKANSLETETGPKHTNECLCLLVQ